MASTRIAINPNGSPLAPQFLSFLSQLASIRDQANRLADIGDSAAADGDFPAFNQLFIGGQMPDKYQVDAVYNLFTGARAILNDPAIKQLLARLGQG